MTITVKRARDWFLGLNMLAGEPIITHFLNFRLKAAILLLQPTVDSLQKTQDEVVKQHAETKDGQAVLNVNSQPKWKSPDDELQATKALSEILDSEVEIPGLVKLPWELLEKARCSFLNKATGTKTTENLVIPAALLLTLDGFIEGEPSA